LAYLEMHGPNSVALKCTFHERDQAKAIGDYHWDKASKKWIFPLTRETIRKTRQEFKGIAIEPEIFTHLTQQTHFQDKIVEIKKLKDCEVDESFIKGNLYPHQRVGVKFLEQFDKACVWDEMGLGKTLTSIAIVLWRKKKGEVKKCIVLAPKSCKETVWARQVEQFTNEKVLVVEGTKKKRKKIYERFKKENILFLIFGYETYRVDHSLLKELEMINNNGNGAEMLILDEVQKIKNIKAQITKAVANTHVHYTVALTGTPVYNRIEDIFSPVNIIKPGLLGSSYWRFSDHFLRMGGYGEHQVVGYQHLKELREKIESVSIRRTTDQVLVLPPKHYEDRELEMTNTEQKRVYEEMRDELFTWVKNMDDQEVKVQASQILSRNIRLSQITNGFITSQALTKPKWFKDSPKITEIDEVLESYADEGVVIFTRWIPMVHNLYNKYKEKYNAVYLAGETPDKMRVENIDKFQDGTSKVFICQIQAGSLGISLNRAKIVIFTDKSFLSLGLLKQAEARVYRNGLKHSCTIISLLINGTIDINWKKLIEKKGKLAKEVIVDRPKMSREDWLSLVSK